MILLDRLLIFLLVKVLIVFGIASKSRQQLQLSANRLPSAAVHMPVLDGADISTDRPSSGAFDRLSSGLSGTRMQATDHVDPLFDPKNRSIQQIIQFPGGIVLFVDDTSVVSMRQASGKEAV